MVMDTKALMTLHNVVRTGSFAATARELGYTASAVSQQMSTLERTLGISLFERSAKSMIPTEAAHSLDERIEEIVDLLDRIDIDIARLGAGQTGRLRVGTFDSAGGPILGRAMARFLVNRREVEITLEEGEPYELFPRVADGSLDIALGFSYDFVPPQFPHSLNVTEVMREQLFIVSTRRHRLASKASVDFAELSEDTWVAHREETGSHKCLAALCAKAGFAPKIAFESNNLGTVQGIVSAGLGVAMIPEISLINRDEVAVLPIATPMPQRRIVSATRLNDSNPVTAAFMEALRRTARR